MGPFQLVAQVLVEVSTVGVEDVLPPFQPEENGKCRIDAVHREKQDKLRTAGFHYQGDHEPGQQEGHGDAPHISGKGFCLGAGIEEREDDHGNDQHDEQ